MLMASGEKMMEVAMPGSVRGRSFTLSNPPLSVTERIALACVEQIASEGRRVSQDEINAAIGSQNTTGSTAAGILGRLEAKGYIERHIYQRGVQVCIVSTGQCTAPPANTAPHWRLRTEQVPAPAIQAIRERAKPIAAMIEAEARMLGKPMSEFLADLVYIGWHTLEAEKEAQA